MRIIFEIILQTLLAFFSILFITRILGRQQVAQLTVQEYVNGITFGSIAGTLATDINQRTWQHLIGLVMFGVLTYLVSYVALKNRSMSKIIQGEPVLVIQEGKILEQNLSRFHYTVDDLTHLLRKKDVFDISSVKFGILETTGELSVLKYSQKDSVKIEDLGIGGKQEEIPVEIIVTGNIIYENLTKRNLTVKWLIEQLKMMGVRDIKEVFYATVDSQNTIYVDKLEDHFNKKDEITEEQGRKE